MSLEVKTTCPLGSCCEKAVDGHIERCAWYVKLEGSNPQNGERIDDWRCAIAWQPLIMIEGNVQTRSVAASIQSFRNESLVQQENAIKVLENVKVIESN
jgi:hypothetical protein